MQISLFANEIWKWMNMNTNVEIGIISLQKRVLKSTMNGVFEFDRKVDWIFFKLFKEHSIGDQVNTIESIALR